MVGYIFAVYSVAVIGFSPLVGKFISVYGRRNIIGFGIVLMGMSFILFGISDYINSSQLFLIASFITRFLQGLSSSCI